MKLQHYQNSQFVRSVTPCGRLIKGTDCVQFQNCLVTSLPEHSSRPIFASLVLLFARLQRCWLVTNTLRITYKSAGRSHPALEFEDVPDKAPSSASAAAKSRSNARSPSQKGFSFFATPQYWPWRTDLCRTLLGIVAARCTAMYAAATRYRHVCNGTSNHEDAHVTPSSDVRCTNKDRKITAKCVFQHSFRTLRAVKKSNQGHITARLLVERKCCLLAESPNTLQWSAQVTIRSHASKQLGVSVCHKHSGHEQNSIILSLP